ncbi:hypothetical protein Tco_0701276 [Tanacetum coccineum]
MKSLLYVEVTAKTNLEGFVDLKPPSGWAESAYAVVGSYWESFEDQRHERFMACGSTGAAYGDQSRMNFTGYLRWRPLALCARGLEACRRLGVQGVVTGCLSFCPLLVSLALPGWCVSWHALIGFNLICSDCSLEFIEGCGGRGGLSDGEDGLERLGGMQFVYTSLFPSASEVGAYSVFSRMLSSFALACPAFKYLTYVVPPAAVRSMLVETVLGSVMWQQAWSLLLCSGWVGGYFVTVPMSGSLGGLCYVSRWGAGDWLTGVIFNVSNIERWNYCFRGDIGVGVGVCDAKGGSRATGGTIYPRILNIHQAKVLKIYSLGNQQLVLVEVNATDSDHVVVCLGTLEVVLRKECSFLDRLEFGKCNMRHKTDIKPKEATFQVVLDALALTPFYQAFLITSYVPTIYIHEDTQVYGTILPKELTNQAMLESKAYQIYYAFASGEKAPKPKYIRKKADSETISKKKECSATKGDGVDTQSKVPDEQQQKVTGTNEGAGVSPEVPDVPKYDSESEEESWTFSQDDEDAEEESDMNDDSEETESDNDGDDLTHPNLSTYKADEEEEEEDDDLHRDLNINLERSDVEITDAQANQDTKDTHVTLTTVPPVVQQQSSSISSDLVQFAEAVSSILGIVDTYLAYKKKEAVDVAVQLQTNKLREKAQAENQEFLNRVYSTMKAIIKEQVQTQVFMIMPKIKKYVTKSLEAEVSDTQKNLYNALVESYNTDKDIISSYADFVTLKRGRDDQDKDEDPSAGSSRGSKRRRSGKEAESSKESKDKDLKSTSSSKGASKS